MLVVVMRPEGQVFMAKHTIPERLRDKKFVDVNNIKVGRYELNGIEMAVIYNSIEILP